MKHNHVLRLRIRTWVCNIDFSDMKPPLQTVSLQNTPLFHPVITLGAHPPFRRGMRPGCQVQLLSMLLQTQTLHVPPARNCLNPHRVTHRIYRAAVESNHPFTFNDTSTMSITASPSSSTAYVRSKLI